MLHNNFDPSFDILDHNQSTEVFNTLSIDNNDDLAIDHLALKIDSDLDGKDDIWLIDTSDIQALGIDTDGDGHPDEFLVGVDTDENSLIDDFREYAQVGGDGHFELVEQDWDRDHLHPMAQENNDVYFANSTASDATEHWHQQKYEDCGIVAQEFILDEIGKEYGIKFDEDQLFQEAYNNGWCSANGGTPLDCLGNLLEAKGIEVDRQLNASLDDIDLQLQQGHQVIVAVDSDEIWYPNEVDMDDYLANLHGMPGQDANHAVQVIGIDKTDPSHPMVILNDSGTPNGRGSRVPAETFLNAWEDSNHFMVATTGNLITPNSVQLASAGEANIATNELGSYDDAAYHQDWADWHKKTADWNADRGDYNKAAEHEESAAYEQKKAQEAADASRSS